MRFSVFVVACGFLGLTATTSAQGLDPIVNMCVRFDHQSVVKNNTLYIDGGRETFTDVGSSSNIRGQTGNITQGYNNYLIAIDLSTSWDWKLNISENALVKKPNPSTGTSPPVLSRGALYHGTDQDNKIYLWGGTTSYWNTSFSGYEAPTPQQYSLWSFDVVAQQWDQYDDTLGSANRPSSGSYTDATDQGLSFFFNGELDSGSEIETEKFGNSVKQFLQGMIVIDTNNQTAKNLSTEAVSGDLPRSRGRMQYVSAIGPNGILVQIGGNQQQVTNTTDPYIGDLLPLNEIDVFDVSSYYNANTPDGTWYKQSTSGDTPDGRIDFCLILASSLDGSSHNIYMYGGRGANNVFFDDIWVLSLPAFVWEKVYQGTSPRGGHTCHRVGSRTMITVGGTSNTDYNFPPCDWETKGVGVFDMTDLTWGSVYNATQADYEVPSLVAAKIGVNSSGSPTMTQPKNGFDQNGLAALFISPNVTSPTPASKAATPSLVASDTTPPPSSSRPSFRTAPIIGVIVGGVVFLALSGSLGFYHRQQLRGYFTDSDPQVQEMEGNQRISNEMEGRDACWELPAYEKPVELWSPTDRREKEEGIPF